MNENILIVEDDESLSEGLSEVLESYGYGTVCAKCRKSTMEILATQPIHLVIMDVNLEKDCGYEICQEIRKNSQIPVLFLTGCSSELELIRGFQMGGDDYVAKPFRMQELLVRIQALLRRASMQKNKIYYSGDLVYHKSLYQVFKDKQQLDFSGTEQKIFALLLENWPRTITREELLYEVWDKDAAFVGENTLSVNISRMREKIGSYEKNPYIMTVRGIGYRWAIPVEMQ